MPRKISLDELGRKSIKEHKESKKNPIVLVVDDVRSAHNVGSMFRVADSFLIESIYLCGFTPLPDKHLAIEKTALKASLSVDWHYEKDVAHCLQALKEKGYAIYALEQTTASVDLRKLSQHPSAARDRIALVCGNEVNGVSQQAIDMADLCIEIFQEGAKHSLNVSVAVGIAIWQLHHLLTLKAGKTS